MAKRETIIILENIRSSENVGSIFRTADAAGVSEIVLAGFSPAPHDQFGRPNSALLKASLGAERSVPWRRAARANTIIQNLKRDGYKIIAVEQHLKTINYKKVRSANKIAFIFGNEVSGIKVATLKNADVIAEIPMRGKKESLNVSVAVGVVLYQMLN